MSRLEHVNLEVPNLDEAISFLSAALPDYQIRRRGQVNTGKIIERWAHIGNSDSYLALNDIIPAKDKSYQPYEGAGLNHIGFVVDDVEVLADRLAKLGYRESHIRTLHEARKRLYFLDHAGFEWEFVQYLTDDPEKRNEYTAEQRLPAKYAAE